MWASMLLAAAIFEDANFGICGEIQPTLLKI
jgi:hypothetical protein